MNWLVDWEGYCTVFLVRGRLIGIEPSRDMREYMDSIRFNHGPSHGPRDGPAIFGNAGEPCPIRKAGTSRYRKKYAVAGCCCVLPARTKTPSTITGRSRPRRWRSSCRRSRQRPSGLTRSGLQVGTRYERRLPSAMRTRWCCWCGCVCAVPRSYSKHTRSAVMRGLPGSNIASERDPQTWRRLVAPQRRHMGQGLNHSLRSSSCDKSRSSTRPRQHWCWTIRSLRPSCLRRPMVARTRHPESSGSTNEGRSLQPEGDRSAARAADRMGLGARVHALQWASTRRARMGASTRSGTEPRMRGSTTRSRARTSGRQSRAA